ncbi:hypothetical protein HanRHA438_Chr02g0089381 [Helianthus annuus]|nr:hypothetical protein HanIR_Chr02g0090951 [Helianthus annuus]KAJ0940972.1 hypothetical protein HanRHA438_Chr02g0089381 [Helianthus annuus]
MGLRQGIFCLFHIDHQPFPFYLLPLLPLEFSQTYNWHHYHQGNAHNKQTPLSLSCLDRRPEIGAPTNRRWLWLTATVVPRNSGSRDVYGNPVTAESRRRQWRQGSGGGCANRPLHLRYVRLSQVRPRFRRQGSTRFGSV